MSFDVRDLAIDQGDQAMTFLPESRPRASEVITSALPFWVEPLPLPFWLKARSTMLGDVVGLLCRGLGVNHGHRAGLGHAADRDCRRGGGAIARAFLGARARCRLRHVQRADGERPPHRRWTPGRECMGGHSRVGDDQHAVGVHGVAAGIVAQDDLSVPLVIV